MISEQDFIQAMLPTEGRSAPLSLTLLELMFGPGVPDGSAKGLQVRKAFGKKITGDVILWPSSQKRPFNILHVGPIKMTDVLRISAKRSHLKSNGPEIIENMAEDILFGFRRRPLQSYEVDSGRQDVVVVMSVLDGDERTTYFWTHLRGRIMSFQMMEPTGNTTDTREHLRDFYAERVALLHGRDWQSAFFLSDLRANLMRELPADWKMTPDGVTATMSPDIILQFNKSFDVRLDFRGRIFWYGFSMITQDYAGTVENTVRHLLAMIMPSPKCYPCVSESDDTPMNAQQIVEIVSPLPPWMRTIFETLLRECHTHDESLIKHIEQGLKSIQGRRDLAKQAMDLLQVPEDPSQPVEPWSLWTRALSRGA